MPVEDSEGEETRFDQRFCLTQKVNFTFGFSDNLYVQFKTDRKWRARYSRVTLVMQTVQQSILIKL